MAASYTDTELQNSVNFLSFWTPIQAVYSEFSTNENHASGTIFDLDIFQSRVKSGIS
jgi:hypothetical protein